jgi:hypothetical protein
MKKTLIEKLFNFCHINLDKKRLILLYVICLIYNIIGLSFLLLGDYRLLALVNVLSIIWIVYDIIIIKKRRK